jgi:preprotein translocase subunit SecY
MLRRFSLLFTDKELRVKLFQIIGLLIFARFLANIPIPLLGIQDISTLVESDQFFALLSTISGGAYGTLSFVMLGVGPFITASIVMQLLGVIVPQINEMQKEEGELGRQKINRWTRYLTVPLAALNSWGIIQFLAIGAGSSGVSLNLPEVLRRSEFSAETFWAWFSVIASMTAGCIIIMWIGEIITEMKLGNGISLIILGGIVSRLPKQIYRFGGEVFDNIKDLFSRFSFDKATNWEVWKAFLWENSTWTPTRLGLIFLLVLVITLFLVVYFDGATRFIKVLYSRRGHVEGKSRTLANVNSKLPVKVIIAGVMPIIFAVSFILFPTILSRFFLTANVESLRNTATAVEQFLSTNPRQIPTADSNLLPKANFATFYLSNSKQEIDNAVIFDQTEGTEIFGFTLSTNPEIKNVFFDNTFARFEFTVPQFLDPLPDFALRWNGILAYTFFYFFLIIFFTFFYTANIGFKTDEISDNLQRFGGYIPGIRPGKETMNYLSYVSNRINIVGALFLALIAIVPIALRDYLPAGDGTLTGIVGGTSLLILVSVTIETLKQIDAQTTTVDYDKFLKY